MEYEDKKQIKRLLEQDEEVLLYKLARELSGDTFISLSKQELLALARKWIADQKEKIVDRVCFDGKVLAYKDSLDNSDTKVLLVIAISDLLTSVFADISPWIVSVLLVKWGVESLCKEKWANRESST